LLEGRSINTAKVKTFLEASRADAHAGLINSA
jgi:hypothetical protein